MSITSKRRRILLPLIILLLVIAFGSVKLARKSEPKKESWQFSTQNLKSTGQNASPIEGIKPKPPDRPNDSMKPPSDLKPGVREGEAR